MHTLKHTHPRLFLEAAVISQWLWQHVMADWFSLFPVSSFSDSLFTFFLFLADLLFVCLSINLCFSPTVFFSFPLSCSYCKFCLSFLPPPAGTLCQDVCYFLCLTLFIIRAFFVSFAQCNQNVGSPRTRSNPRCLDPSSSFRKELFR